MDKKEILEKVKDVKVRVVKDNSNRHVIFALHPVLGFGWGALDVLGSPTKSGVIDSIDYYTGSNVKFLKTLNPVVEAMYAGKCSNINLSSTLVSNGWQPMPVEDWSDGSDEWYVPMEILSLTDVDSSGTTFKDYFDNICTKVIGPEGKPIPCFEVQELEVKENVHLSHREKINFVDSWALLPANIHGNFRFTLDQDEYDSIITRPIVQDLIDYVTHRIPGENTNNVKISGPGAAGKTKSCIALSIYLNRPICLYTGTRSLDKDEMFASVVPNLDPNVPSTWRQNKTDFCLCAEVGGICVLEEWAVTSGELQIGLNNTVYGARRFMQFQDKTYVVHPDTTFIITTNVGYKGTEAFNKAFKERFYSMSFPKLEKDMFGRYLAKKFCKQYPDLKNDVVLEFNSFLYDLMGYMEDNFKNLDLTDTETPAICTRDIPRIINTSIGKSSINKALKEILYGILDGVEEPDTLIEGILSNYSKDITALENKLFVDKAHATRAKQAAKSMFSTFVVPVQGPTINTNNSNDINSSFNRAKSAQSSSCSNVMNSMRMAGNNGGANV